MRSAANALAIALNVLDSGRAEAQPAEPFIETPTSFGTGGQFVLSVDRLAGLSVSVARSDANRAVVSSDVDNCSGTNVVASFFGSSGLASAACASNGFGPIRWGADVFVGQGFSLGGTINFSSDSSDQDSHIAEAGVTSFRYAFSSKSFTLSPRVGYARALASSWAIWPRVGIDWVDSKVEREMRFEEPTGIQGAQQSTFALHFVDAALDVRLVYSPVRHVAFFGGPFATLPIWRRIEHELDGVEVKGQSKLYAVGASAGVLVYL